MPEARSVSIGFWVGIGGRDEPPEIAGASHFLEHLVFKGTHRLSARAIAESVDARGGEMNAFTAREHTAFYVRLPEADLEFGLDLLTQVLEAPALRPHDVDAERQVILEELAAAEDTPDDVVHRALSDALFPDHPLGREVLGDAETIETMTVDDIATFFGTHYRPANLVVAAAGDLDHDRVVAAVDGFLRDGAAGCRPARIAPGADVRPRAVVTRPTEQAHVTLGWRGLDQDDPDRWALAVTNQVLGGGMSSRLFQEIREQRGLVYSVFSWATGYADAGMVGAYAGTSPSKVTEVLEVIDREIESLLADGISAQERDVAVGYLVGSLLLGLEDSGSRMARLGRAETTRGEILSVDEHVARLRAVTIDDAQRVAQRVFRGPRTLAAVGPFDESLFG